MPMPQFVPNTEPSSMEGRVRIYIHNSALFEADNLRFTAIQASKMHINANAVRYSPQIYVFGMRNTKFLEQLFSFAHRLVRFFQIAFTVDNTQAHACFKEAVEITFIINFLIARSNRHIS